MNVNGKKEKSSRDGKLLSVSMAGSLAAGCCIEQRARTRDERTFGPRGASQGLQHRSPRVGSMGSRARANRP
jgi:hypothetical protein